MRTLVFVMGPAGAGKTTLLRTAMDAGEFNCAVVSVGALLRKKYGPAAFNGLQSPVEFQEEAWDIIRKSIEENQDKEFVFFDGQPRSLEQCDRVLCLEPNKVFIHLTADAEERDGRVFVRDEDDPGALELAQRRVQGDISLQYEIMCRLMVRGQRVHVYDTGHPHYNPRHLIHWLETGVLV